MSFADEIKTYTDEDLDLIISTQRDLYSAEEMAQLQALRCERKRIQQEEYEAKVLARLPETINCEKCDGPNPFSNNACIFCGHTLDKSKYYADEYYDVREKDAVPHKSNKEGDSYTFHYIISFLIPLIGFIVGAVMLTNDKAEKRDRGKFCIILGIFSITASAVLVRACLH